MRFARLEILVEEPSCRRALEHLLPKIVPGVEFSIISFNGKPDLLKKLPARLAGYRKWLGATETGLVVLVDVDNGDCRELLRKLEDYAVAAGFTCGSVSADRSGEIMNRLAVEELEAWFFGDVDAIVTAYPGVPATLGLKAKYRSSDDILGGTAEALERVLQAAGHHRGGLRKIAAADAIARHIDVENNQSQSFCKFRDGIRLMMSGTIHAEA